MRQASSLALLGLAAGVAAQTVTAPYTDPLTGIDFQAYTDPETGYIFGIALPETVTTDFIGQIVRVDSLGGGKVGVYVYDRSRLLRTVLAGRACRSEARIRVTVMRGRY